MDDDAKPKNGGGIDPSTQSMSRRESGEERRPKEDTERGEGANPSESLAPHLRFGAQSPSSLALVPLQGRETPWPGVWYRWGVGQARIGII